MKILLLFIFNLLFISNSFASQWTATNLISGSAGTGNVYVNTNFARHYRQVCSDPGWTSASTSCTTWKIFQQVGSDSQLVVPGCTSPVGDIQMLDFTTSTRSMGTTSTAWTDATYGALAFIVLRNDGENFYRIYIPRITRASDCNTATEVDLLKSTDLTGTSWLGPTTVIASAGNVEFMGFVKAQDGNKILMVSGDATHSNQTSLYKCDALCDTLTFYSTISNTSSTNIEGGCVNNLANMSEMLCVMRDSGQGFLKQTTSADYGLNWKNISNTNLGGNNGGAGVKVNPRLVNSASDPTRITTAYYDRAIGRMVISSPTTFRSVFDHNAWTPYYLIGTGSDGNGDMNIVDPINRYYLIMTDTATTPSNNTNWWVGRDIYYPTKIQSKSKLNNYSPK